MSIASYIINWEELVGMLDLTVKGKDIRSIKDINGKQRIKGFAESLPAIQGVYKVMEVSFPSDTILTGIAFSQSGWKGEDYWSLWIDDDKLFDEIYTKETGDHKHFNLIHVIKANQTIKLLVHNNSGNSRDVWCDLEYVEILEEIPEN